MPLAEHDAQHQLDKCGGNGVSIHVPLAEHDRVPQPLTALREVSIHVPLAEHDVCHVYISPFCKSFNSRAPRGARPEETKNTPKEAGFNSRAPRGARPV